MKKKLKFAVKQSISGICFALPCVIVLTVMMVYPLLQTVLFSFSNIKLPGFALQFNGIQNYIKVFLRPEFPAVIWNTICWTLGSVVLRLVMGMLTALVMNADVPGIRVLRVVVLIPWTVPSIVAANTWRWMLQGDFGVINGILKSWGFPPYSFLSNSASVMPSILIANSWAGYPFVMMMLLAAMQGLPREHYESAMVDGANTFQRFWHITIPGIKPVLLILTALETINGINAFDMIYNMTGGGPGNATTIFGIFVYRLGFTNLDFGGASAVSMVLVALAVVLCFFYVLFSKSGAKGGGK
jgi:multiple sugar transport system permease protein